MKTIILLLTPLLFFTSCGEENDLETVADVDINKYAGKWYEIARLPNSFEKGMTCVTATYTLKENGKIEVLNAGVLKDKDNKRKDITGTAWVPDEALPGRLKVRFFWPFAGDYYIMHLDANYQYALVGSPTRNFLWILSRKPQLEQAVIDHLLSIAKEAKFDIDAVEMISQDCG
jgi:apolipoprotein D and lipocalin family protein